MMKGQPINQTLVLDQTEEARLPIGTEIVVAQCELLRAPRQDPDLVSTDAGFGDADVAAAVDHDGGVARLIGIRPGIGSLQGSALKIDGDVVAAHDDWRTREAIRLGDHPHRLGDDHPWLQLDRALGVLRKREYQQQHGSNLCSALSFRSPLLCPSWCYCWRLRLPRSPRRGGGITTATRRSLVCSSPPRSSCIWGSTLRNCCKRSSTSTSASSSSSVRSSS